MIHYKIVQICFCSSYFLCVADLCNVSEFTFVTNGGMLGVQFISNSVHALMVYIFHATILLVHIQCALPTCCIAFVCVTNFRTDMFPP